VWWLREQSLSCPIWLFGWLLSPGSFAGTCVTVGHYCTRGQFLLFPGDGHLGRQSRRDARKKKAATTLNLLRSVWAGKTAAQRFDRFTRLPLTALFPLRWLPASAPLTCSVYTFMYTRVQKWKKNIPRETVYSIKLRDHSKLSNSR